MKRPQGRFLFGGAVAPRRTPPKEILCAAGGLVTPRFARVRTCLCRCLRTAIHDLPACSPCSTSLCARGRRRCNDPLHCPSRPDAPGCATTPPVTRLREPFDEPNAACVVRACEGSDVDHQHRVVARSRERVATGAPRRSRRDRGRPSRFRGCSARTTTGRGGSQGALALEGPLGPAEGVARSWMD